MIKSMTGYGRAVQTFENREITVEIRSVNNRYLDCSVKLPRVFGFAEDSVKAKVKEEISRGKVDVFVSVNAAGVEEATVSLNRPVLEGYLRAMRTMVADYGVQDDISASALSALPDIFVVEKPEEDEKQNLADLTAVAAEAIAVYQTMRETEGAAMAADLSSRAETIRGLVGRVEERSPVTLAEYRTRLENKLREVLASTTIDESRILTETAIFADRIAVDEETVRLRSHIAQYRSILELDEPVGRKLDFLIQEFNREANTGLNYNPQVDLQPIFGAEGGSLKDTLAAEAGGKAEDILATDLVLCITEKAQRVGLQGEYFMSGRIDDLECAYATLYGFLQGRGEEAGRGDIWVMFDNEEVGSSSRQGAQGSLMSDVLARIEESLGVTKEQSIRARTNCLLLSADNGHAIHPNHPEKSDQKLPVNMGGGVILKYNARQTYTTSGLTGAAFTAICEKAGVPVQTFANRADVAGGSTLGNLLGLVCDPVAGLVEMPCAKRNASGVANALVSADLALSGIFSEIPFDEVVEAMYKVGKALPSTLRETALGGVATTPTALAMKEKIYGKGAAESACSGDCASCGLC